MIQVHHILSGTLQKPPRPRVVCHGLLLEGPKGLALIDPGIGLRDIADPLGRIGPEPIDAAGFEFDEANSAIRRIEALGFSPDDVANLVLTHADPDHAGALADFPTARVHLSQEELAALAKGNPRYSMPQFDHGPGWVAHGASSRKWFGLEARSLDLGLGEDIFLIPLFGHTLGQCGVAIPQGDGWLLHVGDAYYLRVELETDDHPVSQLATLRADDDARRRSSLEHLRRLAREHADEVAMLGYHDPSEFPGAIEPAISMETSR